MTQIKNSSNLSIIFKLVESEMKGRKNSEKRRLTQTYLRSFQQIHRGIWTHDFPELLDKFRNIFINLKINKSRML